MLVTTSQQRTLVKIFKKNGINADKLLNTNQIAAWAAQGAHSPGLGKTAIAEGLALHIIKGGIPLSTA